MRMQSSSTAPRASHFCATPRLPAGCRVSENTSPTKEALIKFPHTLSSSHNPSPHASQHWPGPCHAVCSSQRCCRAFLLPVHRCSQAARISNTLRSPGHPGASVSRGSLPPLGLLPLLPAPCTARCPGAPGRPARRAPRAGALPAPAPLRSGPQPPPGASAAPPPRPPRGGSAPAAAPRPRARPVPLARCQRRPRCRGAAGEAAPAAGPWSRSGRGSVELRRRGRAPPPRPIVCAAEAEQSDRSWSESRSRSRSWSRPARPTVRRCRRAEQRASAAGQQEGVGPGAGTYTVRPALAALTSRTIRPRQDVPQPLWCPGAPVPRSLR